MTEQASGKRPYKVWSVEDYISAAPDRVPRFTESDLRIVAELAYENGWDGALIWAGLPLGKGSSEQPGGSAPL